MLSGSLSYDLVCNGGVRNDVSSDGLSGGGVLDRSSGGSFLGGSLDDLGAKDWLLLSVSLEFCLGLCHLNGVLSALVTLEGAPVASELQECANLLGGLGANAEPVLSAVRADLDDRGVLGGVILANFLNNATIALGARVGNDDAVVGGTDFSHALQTNFYSHVSPGR